MLVTILPLHLRPRPNHPAGTRYFKIFLPLAVAFVTKQERGAMIGWRTSGTRARIFVIDPAIPQPAAYGTGAGLSLLYRINVLT